MEVTTLKTRRRWGRGVLLKRILSKSVRGEDWIHLVQKRGWWRDLESMAVNLLVPLTDLHYVS
jgi:hypothetical protein